MVSPGAGVFLLFGLCLSLEYRGPLRSRLPGDLNVSSFPQLIDHFHGSGQAFEQRYYYVPRPKNDSSPIKNAILYIAGESDAFSSGHDRMTNFSADLNAPVFTLEHRYFGTSFPTRNASTESYAKYLNVGQVLADLANFATQMKTEYNMPAAKWLIVGGSYSGLLSSFAREVYPNVFHAAISSSGVVLATDNYADFDLQIAITMGQECASVARAARLEIERLWELGQEDWILKQFGCEGLTRPTDFLFVLGDIFTISPQYSERGRLCDPLVDTLRTGADPVMALAKFSREYFIPHFCDGDVVATYSSDWMKNVALCPSNTGARSWQWMTCNEVAYWQVSPGRLSIRPKNLTQEWYADQCEYIFGSEYRWPNVTKFNEDYNGLKQNATRVFYTTGSQDPWTWTCVTEDSGVPPGCIAHTIMGNEIGHCTDLRPGNWDSPPDLLRTKDWERKVIKQWMAEDP
jgi:hypothetical protein